MVSCGFSIDHWRETLQKAVALGYRFVPFEECLDGAPTGQTILLRHDVDVSLELAARLAAVEIQMGIVATYFVRLQARFYQPLHPDSLPSLYQLCQTNARLNLHYDRQFYESIGQDHLDMLRRDTKILSAVLERPVTGCAAHRPGTFAPFNLAEVRKAGMLYEAYAPEFVQRRKYISDSAGRWREGCLCKWLGQQDHLTVLTHPVWWFDSGMTREQIIGRIHNGD